MPAAARLGDIGAKHDSCVSVPISSGSSSVYIDGRPAARLGDIFEAHSCSAMKHSKHIPVISSGSSSVYIDGRPAARLGDTTSCIPLGTGVILTGSKNINIE